MTSESLIRYDVTVDTTGDEPKLIAVEPSTFKRFDFERFPKYNYFTGLPVLSEHGAILRALSMSTVG